MSVQTLKITSVNVHKSSARTHAILQKSTADILLIQEPWHGTVATLRSDTNIEGDPQIGETANNMWDAHVPKLKPDTPCKALTYTRRSLKSIVRHIDNHPAAGPNTTVIEIDNGSTIAVQIINFYHDVPKQGHGLDRLLKFTPDDTTTTLILGDFNTHSPRWSIPGRTPSSWADRLTDWMDDNGFECINPLHAPTWTNPRPDTHPSVLDLVLANDAAIFSKQVGEVEISFGDSLGSDHAAVSVDFHPLDSLHLVPAPRPSGYRAEPEQRDAWVKEFTMSLPPCLPYTPSHCTAPNDRESTSERWSTIAVAAQTSLKLFDDAIQIASQRTLKPKRGLDPKGTRWWNDECSVAHTQAWTATGEARHEVSLNLKRTVIAAKRKWAHDRLHHALDPADIWDTASHRKG